MENKNSYWEVIRRSSISGGAQAINILLALLKMKAVSLLLGPNGVGILSLYMSLSQTASILVGLGLGAAGTRQISAAHAKGGEVHSQRTWHSVLFGSIVLAFLGGVLFLLYGAWIIKAVFSTDISRHDVQILAFSVMAVVIASAFLSLLTAHRMIGSIAWITIISGTLSTIAGILLLWLHGVSAIAMLIALPPLATIIVASYYVCRVYSNLPFRLHPASVADEWRILIPLGSALMIGGLAGSSGQLLVRSIIQARLGSDALGYFQAAWSIGITYIGVFLAAMATDYLPRLSSAFSDKAEARRIINEQTEVLLFFIGPVIVLIISHAPFMVEILYSDQFFPAADMLRLQLLGDVLKVMSWPLSFAIVAAGKGRAYVLIEIYSVLIFSLSVYILIPFYGLNAAGIAFVLLYVTYLPLVHYFGGKPVDFAWSAEVKRLFGMIALTSFLVFLVCSISEVAGAFAGTLFALLLVLYAMTKLSVWSKVRRLIVAAKVGW